MIQRIIEKLKTQKFCGGVSSYRNISMKLFIALVNLTLLPIRCLVLILLRCFVRHYMNDIHAGLCHPGITRTYHFVRSKNLPFSLDDVRKLVNKCKICAEIKPKFRKPPELRLIKAIQPMERLSIDFKGPLPSSSKNKYLLTVIDEYS